MESYAKHQSIIINQGGWLILQDLLNERVAKGEASDPHDFNVHAFELRMLCMPMSISVRRAVRVSFAEQTSKGPTFSIPNK